MNTLQPGDFSMEGSECDWMHVQVCPDTDDGPVFQVHVFTKGPPQILSRPATTEEVELWKKLRQESIDCGEWKPITASAWERLIERY